MRSVNPMVNNKNGMMDENESTVPPRKRNDRTAPANNEHRIHSSILISTYTVTGCAIQAKRECRRSRPSTVMTTDTNRHKQRWHEISRPSLTKNNYETETSETRSHGTFAFYFDEPAFPFSTVNHEAGDGTNAVPKQQQLIHWNSSCYT